MTFKLLTALAVCEEFVATLQILLADLATTDLVLLPTAVRVEAGLTEQGAVSTDEVHSNDEAKWIIGLPRKSLLPDRDHSDTIPSVVALAGVMLGKCSALSADGFNRRLTDAVKTGLQEKAMVIRAYTHLFLELVPASDFDQDGRSAFSPPFLDDEVVCREAVELGWTEGDGPGYSEERSREFIANRYRRAMRPIRFTLPRLVADPVVGPKLLALRAKGVKDWEILLLVANRVVGYRAELIRPRTSAEHKRVIDELMNKEEDDASPSVPLEIFSDEQINTQLMTGVAAMAKTWDLHLHRQTPDFKALRRLLEARYHIGRDDIPHDDIFGCKTE